MILKSFSKITKNLVLAICLIWLCFFPSEISVLALSFVDDTQAEFDAGTYSNTVWNTNRVNLNAAGQTAGTGTFTSNIKNFGASTTFSDFSWTPTAPFEKELKDNLGTESYSTGNMSMTGNTGLWHLNETAATPANFADTSGAGNNLTCGTVCPAVFANGQFNGGRNMTATNQFYVIPNTLSVKNLATVSLSMWFYPTSAGTTRTLWNEVVATSANQRLTVFMLNTGAIRLRTRNGDAATLTTRVTSTNLATLNAWNHVAVVYNATTDVHKIYLNGTLTQATSAVDAFPNTDPQTPPQFGRNGTVTTTVFLGAMDEIAMFNREVTATEVASLYQRGALKLRYQIRSCDDPACSGEAFIGPDGTGATFYTDLNATSYPPSFGTLPVTANQYFQYQATLLTSDTTLTPAFNQVSADYISNDSFLAFNIRNSGDTANINVCDLGSATVTAMVECSYRLKVETNVTTGYTVFVNVDAGLNNPSYGILDAVAGSGGTGGHDISNATSGTERYGVFVAKGNATGGTTTLNSIFNAGATNEVNYTYLAQQSLYTSSGANLPSTTDTTNTSLITHRLNISTATPAGYYDQAVTYTVVPNF